MIQTRQVWVQMATSQNTDNSPRQNNILTRLMVVVGTGYLFFILADPRHGLAKIAIQFLLKDHLHLGPAQIAGFTALTAFAWYCKPVAGLITDNFLLFGSRRKAYLLAMAGLSAVSWLGLSFLPPSYSVLFWCLFVVNVVLMIGQTTLGGTLVETGQEFQATGRMSSIRIGSENAGILLSGLLGGWLASHLLGKVFAINAALLGLFVFLTWRFFLEKPAVREGPPTNSLKSTLTQLKQLFRSKTMWIATGFWMLARFVPGFGTPLFFHQSETLKFSSDFIGILTFIGASASVVGSIAYLWACRKFPLNKLLYVGATVNVLTTICYFGYQSSGLAMVIQGIHGLGTALSFMAILDLLARATPKRSEAFGYALIFSLGNISVSVSDVLGSSLFEMFHKTFSSMVWLNTAAAVLVLLAIPFLPKILVSHRDGQMTTADI